MWEIFSVGDSAFLERVLIALGMFSGTGNFEAVAGIGMLVGLLIAAFKSIMNGGTGIKFQDLLVSWIIFMAIFGGGARVAIEDSYTGTVRVVDNVPQGVAIAGSIVSHLGYGITQLFEQGYSDVSMIDHGFAYSLEALADSRKAMSGKAALGAANSPRPGDDVWQSWSNYIRECTMVGVDLGEFTIHDINTGRRFPNQPALDQLQFDSETYGTRLVLAGASGNMTCREAFNTLSTFTNTEFSQALYGRLAEALEIEPADAPQGIDDAMRLLGQVGENSQDLMITMALSPIYEWGSVGNEMDFQRVASASMLHDAIQQRNTLWSAEQALFNTVVQPMMTFFEALIFAITPMMAFLIGLGATGFSLIGKYLMMMFWIQLWMPVMSIVNLYLHMSVGGEMEALQAHNKGNLPLDSFYGIHALDATLQTWMSTAGMLAASIPAITLMLVYGSAVTASSLASRITGGTPNTDAVSPKTLSNTSAVEVASAMSSNRITGQTGTGSESMATQFSAGAEWTETESSAKRAVEGATSQASASLSERVTATQNSGQSADQRIGTAFSQTGSNSETDQYAIKTGRQILDSAGITRNVTDATAHAIGVSLGAGTDLKVGTASGQTNTIGNTTFSDQETQALSNALSTASESGTSYQAGFVQALAKDQSAGRTNSVSTGLGLSNDKAVTESLAKVSQAQESYDTISSASSKQGQSTSFKETQLPYLIQQSPALQAAYSNFMENWGTSPEFLSEANGHAEMAAAKFTMSPEEAQAVGAAKALMDGSFISNLPEPYRLAAAEHAAGFVNALFSSNTPDRDGASANSSLQGNVDQRLAGDIRPVQGPGTTAPQVRAAVGAGFATTEQAIAAADPSGFKESGSQRFANTHASEEQSLFAQQNNDLLEGRLQSLANLNPWGLETTELVPHSDKFAETFKPRFTKEEYNSLTDDQQKQEQARYSSHLRAQLSPIFDSGRGDLEYATSSLAAKTANQHMFKEDPQEGLLDRVFGRSTQTHVVDDFEDQKMAASTNMTRQHGYGSENADNARTIIDSALSDNTEEMMYTRTTGLQEAYRAADAPSTSEALQNPEIIRGYNPANYQPEPNGGLTPSELLGPQDYGVPHPYKQEAQDDFSHQNLSVLTAPAEARPFGAEQSPPSGQGASGGVDQLAGTAAPSTAGPHFGDIPAASGSARDGNDGAAGQNAVTGFTSAADGQFSDQQPTTSNGRDGNDGAAGQNAGAGFAPTAGNQASDQQPTSAGSRDGYDGAAGQNAGAGFAPNAGNQASDQQPTSAGSRDGYDGAAGQNAGAGFTPAADGQFSDQQPTTSNGRDGNDGAAGQNAGAGFAPTAANQVSNQQPTSAGSRDGYDGAAGQNAGAGFAPTAGNQASDQQPTSAGSRDGYDGAAGQNAGAGFAPNAGNQASDQQPTSAGSRDGYDGAAGQNAGAGFTPAADGQFSDQQPTTSNGRDGNDGAAGQLAGAALASGAATQFGNQQSTSVGSRDGYDGAAGQNAVAGFTPAADGQFSDQQPTTSNGRDGNDGAAGQLAGAALASGAATQFGNQQSTSVGSRDGNDGTAGQNAGAGFAPNAGNQASDQQSTSVGSRDGNDGTAGQNAGTGFAPNAGNQASDQQSTSAGGRDGNDGAAGQNAGTGFAPTAGNQVSDQQSTSAGSRDGNDGAAGQNAVTGFTPAADGQFSDQQSTSAGGRDGNDGAAGQNAVAGFTPAADGQFSDQQPTTSNGRDGNDGAAGQLAGAALASGAATQFGNQQSTSVGSRDGNDGTAGQNAGAGFAPNAGNQASDQQSTSVGSRDGNDGTAGQNAGTGFAPTAGNQVSDQQSTSAGGRDGNDGAAGQNAVAGFTPAADGQFSDQQPTTSNGRDGNDGAAGQLAGAALASGAATQFGNQQSTSVGSRDGNDGTAGQNAGAGFAPNAGNQASDQQSTSVGSRDGNDGTAGQNAGTGFAPTAGNQVSDQQSTSAGGRDGNDGAAGQFAGAALASGAATSFGDQQSASGSGPNEDGGNAGQLAGTALAFSGGTQFSDQNPTEESPRTNDSFNADPGQVYGEALPSGASSPSEYSVGTNESVQMGDAPIQSPELSSPTNEQQADAPLSSASTAAAPGSPELSPGVNGRHDPSPALAAGPEGQTLEPQNPQDQAVQVGDPTYPFTPAEAYALESAKDLPPMQGADPNEIDPELYARESLMDIPWKEVEAMSTGPVGGDSPGAHSSFGADESATASGNTATKEETPARDNSEPSGFDQYRYPAAEDSGNGLDDPIDTNLDFATGRPIGIDSAAGAGEVSIDSPTYPLTEAEAYSLESAKDIPPPPGADPNGYDPELYARESLMDIPWKEIEMLSGTAGSDNGNVEPTDVINNDAGRHLETSQAEQEQVGQATDGQTPFGSGDDSIVPLDHAAAQQASVEPGDVASDLKPQEQPMADTTGEMNHLDKSAMVDMPQLDSNGQQGALDQQSTIDNQMAAMANELRSEMQQSIADAQLGSASGLESQAMQPFDNAGYPEQQSQTGTSPDQLQPDQPVPTKTAFDLDGSPGAARSQGDNPSLDVDSTDSSASDADGDGGNKLNPMMS